MIKASTKFNGITGTIEVLYNTAETPGTLSECNFKAYKSGENTLTYVLVDHLMAHKKQTSLPSSELNSRGDTFNLGLSLSRVKEFNKKQGGASPDITIVRKKRYDLSDLSVGMEYSTEKDWTWKILTLTLPNSFSAMRVQQGQAAKPFAAVHGDIKGLLYSLNKIQFKQKESL